MAAVYNRLSEQGRRHPLLLPSIALAVGILAARCFALPIWGLAIFAVVAVALAVFGRVTSMASVVMAVFGYINGSLALPMPLSEDMDGRNVAIVGTVAASEPGANGTRYTIDVFRCEDGENGRLYPGQFKTSLSYNGIDTYRPGDTICVYGVLLDAAATSIVPDAANYNKYLYLKGVNSVVWSPDNSVSLVGRGTGGIGAAVDDMRYSAASVFMDSGVDASTAAFLTAVIVGDDSYLAPDTEAHFRISGLAHLLALSGLHFGIIIMIVTLCLSWVKLLRHGYTLFYVAIMAAACAYAVFAGMSPSVVRAACMVVVMCLAAMLQRRNSVADSLLLAIFLWLVAKPLWLFSPGFQMSAFAVIGIVIAARAIGSYGIRRVWLKRLATAVIVPVAAMAATSIPAMAYFHVFPLYFLPANILASVIITPLMFCGVLLLAASALCVPHGAVAFLTDKLYGLIEGTARLFGGEGAVVHTYPSALTLVCMSLVIGAFFAVLLRPRSVLRFASLCCAVILASLSVVYSHSSVSVDAYVLEDGRASEILLADTDSVYLLTDATGINAANNLMSRQELFGDMVRRRNGYPYLVGISGGFSRRNFKRDGDVLACGRRSILLANSDTLVLPVEHHCDYALVCREFSGDVGLLARYADTILLGPSVHPSRRRKYSACMDTIGIPYRDLRRDGGVALHIKTD